MSFILRCTIPLYLLALSSLSFAKPYKGAELYSIDEVLYGKFNVRMRAAKGSGLLSTFFTYKNGSEQTGVFWEEIDIEIFGKNNAEAWQSNIITGDTNLSFTETEHHGTGSFGDAYHTFSIEWRPSSVTWLVDGETIRVIDSGNQVSALTNAASYRFNIWPSTSEAWTGPWDDAILPVYMYVNWIEFYSWNGNDFDFEWRDDFDTLENSRWQKATWTFDGNRSDFAPENITVQDGTLVLGLTHEGQTGFSGNIPEDNSDSNTSSSSTSSSSSSSSTSSSSSASSSSGGTQVDHNNNNNNNNQLDLSVIPTTSKSSGGANTLNAQVAWLLVLIILFRRKSLSNKLN